MQVFSKGQITKKMSGKERDVTPPSVNTSHSEPQEHNSINAREEMEKQELEHQKSLTSPSEASGKDVPIIRKSDLKSAGKIAISNEERAKVLQRIKVQ